MRALSLWQPWASLWISGRKIHETRGWPLTVPHGGFWLAVHAAKRLENEGKIDPELREICEDELGGHWAMDLPRGALIGRVHVVSCHHTDDLLAKGVHYLRQDDYICGNFAPGRYAFETDDRRTLTTPIPYRGMQGTFTVPDWPLSAEPPHHGDVGCRRSI